MAKSSVSTGLKGIGLGDSVIGGLLDGVGDAKLEFRALLSSLDLTTEGGRQTYAALMELSPAFALVADGISDTADKAAEAAREMATTIAGFDAAGLGKMMLDAAFNPQEGYTSAQAFGAALNTSIRNALITNTINTVAESLFAGIITPILLGQEVSEATTDALIADAVSKADRLAEVLGSPRLAQAIESIATVVGTTIERIGIAVQSVGALNVQTPTVTRDNVSTTGVGYFTIGGDTGTRPAYPSAPPSNGGYSGYYQPSTGSSASNAAEEAAKAAEDLRKAKLAIEIELLEALGR